jgi:glycosyltransferase involved in cell wall biosynthesis
MSPLTSKENFGINSGTGLRAQALDHAFDSNSSKVSIIIPHFNRGELLLQTLSSIVNQTYKNWEVIVVDDGSDPNEWSRAQQFADSRVRFVQRDSGIKGPSQCRNLGLKEITGNFVMFVDSDDIVAPWCLAERTVRIEASPDVDYCVFPVMLFQKTPGDMATLWNRLEGDNDLERFLKSDPPWHTSSPLWRRAAIEQLCGFDEEIMYGDDADLHMRALFAKLCYAKAGDHLPDVFVRRATNDRITNTLSDRLLDSRMTRLAKGKELVKKYGISCQQRQWEGQYFVEAEFLLFNVPNSRQRQQDILRMWRQNWTPTAIYSLVASYYFYVAHLTKDRCYLLLRIARRLAMTILPREFFPRGGSFESVELPTEMLNTLKAKLAIVHA